MSSSVIDLWLDRLSEAEEEQHLFTPVVAAPVGRKRKADETLKRQADEDLENYQALESRSLRPFLFISGSAKSGSSAKKRKTDAETSSNVPPSLTDFSTRESSGGEPTSSKRSETLLQEDLADAIPAITSTDSLDLDQVPPRGLALYNYLQVASDPPYLPGSLKRIIQNHPTHKLSKIAGCVWEEPGKPPIFNLDADRLQNIFGEEVRAILANSHSCHFKDETEDSWCNKAVQPTLNLALKMSNGSSRCRRPWLWESVQTIKIDRDFLPSLDSSKIDKRTDFTLTLSDKTDPAVRKIRERMGYTDFRRVRPTLSHVASPNHLCRLPVFSGVEVKSPLRTDTKRRCNASFGVPQMSTGVLRKLLSAPTHAYSDEVL